MKTLKKLYETRLEDLKTHSLAGLFALAGNIEIAMRIASHEGDILYVDEIMEGIRKYPLGDGLDKRVFGSEDITDHIKSLYCLAVSDYGNLGRIIDFAKSKPELWDYILDNLDGKEDGDVCRFALAVGVENVVRRCIDHLVACHCPSPLEIEKMITTCAQSAIVLSKKQKAKLIRAAIAGCEKPEEVTAIERLVGRKLTDAEQKRYLANRFRDHVDMNMLESVDWVWKYQKRNLTAHERRLLRKEAKELLQIRSEK